ncbi:kinase-like domain-containing protein [Exophiala viscosa]|uniref:kinase-like domain-containing protein n=1 Tax=Exophiala viscosa TaxID=2486360 RepID=UPI00219BE146|nr:kinase-like domain-containing protein [Exophiala viscosa]
MVLFPVVQAGGRAYEPAPWTRDRSKVQRRINRWRLKRWFDRQAEAFALSKARVKEDDDADWECTDMLGRGAFGMVGQWSKYDSRGNVVDTIAIKQADIDTYREVAADGSPTLPWEALIMRGLAQNGCNNSTELRGLKFYTAESPMKWRYYLEYYKYGSLHSLVESYKDWNRRHPGRPERIPEAFIWQALHGLALAAYHMWTVRFDDIVIPGRDPYVLHLDLKHENVLLGDPRPDRTKMQYPTLKVGDWGMAEYTSRDDPNNSRKYRNYGTIIWMPPEQRDRGRYGSNWRHRVLGTSESPYSIAHVIWQVGANIYGLMTMDLYNEQLDKMVDRCERSEHELRGCGYSPFGPGGYRSSHYSSKLTKLVEDCLRLDPHLRPSPSELGQRASDGMQPYTDRYLRTGKLDVLRLNMN